MSSGLYTCIRTSTNKLAWVKMEAAGGTSEESAPEAMLQMRLLE
jgi:hypothetical protein